MEAIAQRTVSAALSGTPFDLAKRIWVAPCHGNEESAGLGPSLAARDLSCALRRGRSPLARAPRTRSCDDLHEVGRQE